jgi:hypothetical protein
LYVNVCLFVFFFSVLMGSLILKRRR